MIDDHLWWSVFSRPLRSRHSRKQRVSLCLGMIMMSLLAGGMFYGTIPERTTDGYFKIRMLSFDPYDVSYRQNCNELKVLLLAFLFLR